MLVTTSWIEKNYNKFNKLYFGNTLPHIKFKTSRSKNTWGYASFRYDFRNNTVIPECITLSNYYDSPEDVKIQTLLHEMIHIEDYTWHPEHFIRNGRKIRANYYDAHGQWFCAEAARISKESGYKVAKHVTSGEIKRSCVSERSKQLEECKNQDARILAAFCGADIWYFKTDVYKIKNVLSLIKRNIPEYSKVIEYSFDNKNLACRRSCNTKLSGWHLYKADFMKRMEQYKATQIKTYHI